MAMKPRAMKKKGMARGGMKAKKGMARGGMKTKVTPKKPKEVKAGASYKGK